MADGHVYHGSSISVYLLCYLLFLTFNLSDFNFTATGKLSRCVDLRVLELTDKWKGLTANLDHDAVNLLPTFRYQI